MKYKIVCILFFIFTRLAFSDLSYACESLKEKITFAKLEFIQNAIIANSKNLEIREIKDVTSAGWGMSFSLFEFNGRLYQTNRSYVNSEKNKIPKKFIEIITDTVIQNKTIELTEKPTIDYVVYLSFVNEKTWNLFSLYVFHKENIIYFKLPVGEGLGFNIDESQKSVLVNILSEKMNTK